MVPLSDRTRTFVDVAASIGGIAALFMLYTVAVFFVFRDAPTGSIILGGAVLLAATVLIARRTLW